MAQEIKDLIAKIQEEGIKKARDLAGQIEAKAHDQAQKIITQAHDQAQKIIAASRQQEKNTRQGMEASLNQAGRDFLISLRARINEMLNRLVAQNIRQALTPEELAGIISALIKGAVNKPGPEIIVTLSAEDHKQLEKFFLKKLIEETKSQIVLKSSDQISAGLRISFDTGKSHFDFSDSALAEYISANISPELGRILKTG
jgi:vacuolar-type H+-ATPase subunit E/Vma4